MAESFGNAFTIVEVTADDWAAGRPRKELWVAAGQTRSSADVGACSRPEGWMGELVIDRLTHQQKASPEKLDLKPGEVCKLTK
jgi:hypothetical protein